MLPFDPYITFTELMQSTGIIRWYLPDHGLVIASHAYTPTFPACIVEALFGEESYVVTVVWGENWSNFPSRTGVTSPSTLLAIGSDPLMVHEIVTLGKTSSRID